MMTRSYFTTEAQVRGYGDIHIYLTIFTYQGNNLLLQPLILKSTQQRVQIRVMITFNNYCDMHRPQYFKLL